MFYRLCVILAPSYIVSFNASQIIGTPAIVRHTIITSFDILSIWERVKWFVSEYEKGRKAPLKQVCAPLRMSENMLELEAIGSGLEHWTHAYNLIMHHVGPTC